MASRVLLLPWARYEVCPAPARVSSTHEVISWLSRCAQEYVVDGSCGALTTRTGRLPRISLRRAGFTVGLGHPTLPARMVQDCDAPPRMGATWRARRCSLRRSLKWGTGVRQSRHSMARALPLSASSVGEDASGA